MEAIIDAPPTVDTLTWEQAVDIGAKFWEDAEQSKWALGDIGAIVAHKWQHDSVKKFANDIGMFDNPRRLYEYVSVAQFWEKSARAEFADCSWSAFREVSRHSKTLSEAVDLMREHGKKPVAAIREAIVGKPTTRSKTFEARHTGAGHILVDDIIDFCPLTYAHPEAQITVTVTWVDDAQHAD